MLKQQNQVEEGRRDWVGLQRWYREPLGRLFGKAEYAILEGILPFLFGYHLVTLGMPLDQDLLALSPISHRCRLDEVWPPSDVQLDLLAEPAYLPIASDCIDVVVLPHVLEFVTEPHAVLREVDRIMIPEGHVIILGFNPLSFWGLWRLLRARRGLAPWDARFFSVTRVRDWLALLGFDTISVQYCFYRPPLKRASLLRRLAFLERLGGKWWAFGGGGYVLLAKKRVSTLTLVRPRWQSSRHLLGGEIAGGASRRCHRDRSR